MPTEVLTRLIIDANSFPTDLITFDHYAPRLTVVEFTHKAFFCPAFANVSTVGYTFTSSYAAAREDLGIIFTQFPQLRKLVFRGKTRRTSILTPSSFQAPPTLERLDLFDARDTQFLDSVDHAAVPWVEGHFFTGSKRRRLTPATLEVLSAEPAIRVHVHFDRKRLANLKLTTGAGRTRIYSGMDSEECVKLPLFSHVTSMAITGLENVWDEFPTITPYRARFSEMPELEELSIVVHDLRWPGIEVKCPRLAVFELVIRPDPDLPGTTIDAYSILRFYIPTMAADGPDVALRLPGLDMPENEAADLVPCFSDYFIGSSLVPSVLPNCI
ncbi:hypothetical protein EXIGLDRAFT_692992 [Exidia glandulosa HHB12029]|uniref:F-box domain-containing protein n=1 Tax=Exidia glandulosa HHB12029 TaxID=1314781 RepID=A0A166MH83_EXIGL|nr:hypothetical protein EXIGLDRAFT_692992 [Exidia glandulosa HHB12029]